MCMNYDVKILLMGCLHDTPVWPSSRVLDNWVAESVKANPTTGSTVSVGRPEEHYRKIQKTCS
jgi:hypothetical protein